MFMKQKIYMLLDRSGSMSSMWAEALNGVNSYVEKLSSMNADVMLAAFDSNGYEVIRNTTTGSWRNVTSEDVSPRGGTPLLDAAGRIMWNMMDSKADRAVLVVITDGHENASTKFKATEIREMTKLLTTKYNYDIVFIGANFDGIEDVMRSNFGINDVGKFMGTSIRGFGDSMAASAAASANYLSTGKGINYSTEDKAKAKA